ncbi:MAG: BON domain-containing protein, partial [Gammaproteobacteria bacterium]
YQGPERSGGHYSPGSAYGSSHREGAYGDARGGEQRPGLLSRLFHRGPKGYQRSDERLKEDISERLMQAGHIDSSDVSITVATGAVTLEGTVPDRYMKHNIEDLVDACPGVQDIDNRIRVSRNYGAGSAGTTASSAATGISSGVAGTSSAGLGGSSSVSGNGGKRKDS